MSNVKIPMTKEIPISNVKINRALISVSDKTGIVAFAKGLNKLGIEILSTGGTAKTLRDNNIPVIEVSDYTGSPEILDGRLKTLHPKIHGGILAIRKNSKHQKEILENNIGPIDMVVVNLYPFEATIAKKDCTLEEAVENIDIGGPTMIRAAAKNWQDVAVVCDPADYEKIISELKVSGRISEKKLFDLAKKVFAMTANYEAAINEYLSSLPFKGGVGTPLKGGELFPPILELTYNKVQNLRYGENPHQKAAFYKCPHLPADVPCISNGHQLHGKELSYNNIMDADAAIEIAREFADKTAAVIIKHTNPCGVAVSENNISEAFIKARDCDPVSAFGGIVALTKSVDKETAIAIGDTFFEVIIAPSFHDAALKILTAKKNLRLIEVNSVCKNCHSRESGNPTNVNAGDLRFCGDDRPRNIYHLRKVAGGLLVQDADNIQTDLATCKVVTKRSPTREEFQALDFAWRVVKHVKSNAIVISTADHILGVGAGQTSRVDSVNIAVDKMNKVVHVGTTVVLASDAFFPFRDGIDISAKAGITAIIQPGGSIRDEEAIQAANENGITMLFTGVRHFKH